MEKVVMFVTELFKIPKSVIEDVSKNPYKFGFNGFGELVYYTNYSRLLPSGRQETWMDTCTRVVEGVLSIRKSWYKIHSLRWDEQYWGSIASSLLYYIYTLKILPPGRGLWAQGTQYVYERGSMALNNCAASLIKPETFAEDLGWVMDALMCGTGVGVRPLGDSTFREKLVCREDTLRWTVPDSREGWVDSVVMLINSFRKEKEHKWCFDYSQVRKKGERITGFGGTASGPEPLIILHERINDYMKNFIEGKYNYTRLSANIVNAIGACIIAGNVRRSAELILGSPYDETFKCLSDYNMFPERAAIGWMSNNSYALENKNDFTRLDDIADSICKTGEGGLINFKNIRKYSRFGDIGAPDNADCANPCLHGDTTVLEKSQGTIRIKALCKGDFVWSKEGWTKVLAVYDQGIKDVYKYETTAGCVALTKNHKIVKGDTKTQVKDATHLERLRGYKLSGYVHSERLNAQDIIDGLVLGDGSNKKGCRHRYLNIGDDDKDYFTSEVADYIGKRLDTKLYQTSSLLTPDDLPRMWDREVPQKFKYALPTKTCGFLRGLYSANGSAIVSKGRPRITLKSTSEKLIEQVQVMLSSVGIASYYTTNKKKTIRFSNGEYLCKESYDLNISSSDTVQFRNYIGFIQKYKMRKLNTALNCIQFNKNQKDAYKITEVSYFGKCHVYDIMVANSSRTFWANGFDVSNCVEIPIYNKGVCNLFEVYPSKARSKKEFLEMCRLATIYTTSVSLLPTHNEATNQVIAKNRRIGVSLSGVADWFDSWGGHIIKFMRSGYTEIREFADHLNAEAGVVSPIRITTVKPSGSVSQLSGVSPGMHFPVHGPYAIRRMRINTTSPVVELCRQAGLYIEPDVNNKDTTQIIEFPIYTGTTRSSNEVSAWEQFSLLALLQREWSDNMVSCTIHFTEEEKKDIPRMLSYFLPTIKSVSLLLKNDTLYPQMPYEKISEKAYQEKIESMKKIDWTKFGGSDGKEAKFCTNDSCEL
jgi:ribonucleotide reductase alpha subunit